MKPKIDFDPMFETSRQRRCWPIRAIGPLTILLALSGLVLRAGPIPPRGPGSPSGKIARIPRGQIAVRGPVANPQVPNLRVGEAQPRDRFVIIAPAEIDPGMVVRARDDLDAEMVFNPDTRRRGLTPGGPAPAGNLLVPGQAQGLSLEKSWPGPWSPQPRVIPRAH